MRGRAVWAAAGAVLAATAGAGSVSAESFTYDGLGRLSTVVHDDGKTTTYAYDLAGNRASVTVAPAAGGMSGGTSGELDEGVDGGPAPDPTPPARDNNDGVFPSLEGPAGG